MRAVHDNSRPGLLILAHNHPRFFAGGAEHMAYELFQYFRKEDGFKPYFLAASAHIPGTNHPGTAFETFGNAPDEILFRAPSYDYFYHSQQTSNFIHDDFRQLLRNLQPDILHFHHTLRIGLEALRVARDTLPNARIFYTLHEYLLICHHNGQMVKTADHSLCDAASPMRCNQCFTHFSPAQFRMREAFIKANLQPVDCFIAPSDFLAQRFVQWGLPKQKIRVVENGRPAVIATPHRLLKKSEKRDRFAYFGQITPYKGAMLLLDAVQNLAAQGLKDFHVAIHGSIEQQPELFKKDFINKLQMVNSLVTFTGPYTAVDMPRLMQETDWVIVPSTWWENSPLVIQEAFQHHRPVICSDIGGMAEKVTHNKDGLHFKAQDAASLATSMKMAMNPALWQQLVRNIRPQPTITACARQYAKLYRAA